MGEQTLLSEVATVLPQQAQQEAAVYSLGVVKRSKGMKSALLERRS